MRNEERNISDPFSPQAVYTALGVQFQGPGTLSGGVQNDILVGGVGSGKSRRWWGGGWNALRRAANDAVFEIRSVG